MLIIVGGIVRVSDSGLGCGPGGCGFHGWPFCNGDVVPGIDLNTSSSTRTGRWPGPSGILIAGARACWPWRRYRSTAPGLRHARRCCVLVLAQAGLGGRPSRRTSKEELVAAHLGLAMLLLGGLL